MEDAFALLRKYRGAVLLTLLLFPRPALAQPEAQKGYIGGVQPCKTCHPDRFESFAATPMGQRFLNNPRNAKEALVCEVCHGPGEAHAAAGGGKGVGGLIAFARKDSNSVEQRNAVCLQCHAQGAVALWSGSTHDNRKLACVDCHAVHGGHAKALAQPTQQQLCTQCHQQVKSALMKPSHHPLREEKMTCTSCHNPHGAPAPKLVAANTANDKCYECHAEKRGPFLWEHAPVKESCLNCHDPHGSPHRPLLVVKPPLLCQRCHSNANHPSTLYALSVPDALAGRSLYTANSQVFSRGCVNCHVQVHGSNHPSGKFWHR